MSLEPVVEEGEIKRHLFSPLPVPRKWPIRRVGGRRQSDQTGAFSLQKMAPCVVQKRQSGHTERRTAKMKKVHVILYCTPPDKAC